MANNYYKKRRLRKEVRVRHENLSEEEKRKRLKKARERYQNFIGEEKNKAQKEPF